MVFYTQIKCPNCFSINTKNFEDDYEGTIQCPDCSEILHVKIKEVSGSSTGLVQDVKHIKLYATLPAQAPSDVKQDFDEALRCFNQANAFKASVAMCRRALENAADAKGASGSRLLDKLQDLAKKGLIDSATFETVSGIREFGNYGSQPQDDLLKDVDELRAEVVVKITGMLLTVMFSKS